MKKDQRLEVYNMYNGRCAYCGGKIEYKDMQIDHVQPKARGGTDEIGNLLPACRRCNHYKRALTLEEFRKQLSTLINRLKKNYINKVAVDFGIIEYHE